MSARRKERHRLWPGARSFHRSILFLLLLVTLASAPLPAQETDLSLSYLPLRLGNLWDYGFTQSGPVVRTALVSDTLRWGGSLYYTLLYDTAAEFPYADTVRVDSMGRIVSLRYGEEVVTYDFTKADADTYHVPERSPRGGDTYWVVSVQHPDSVPGFDACLGMGPCLEVRWTLPGAADADFTEFYAPGIGMVRSYGAWSSNVLIHRVIDGVSTTGVDPVSDPIRAYALRQNYPNPFNPVTAISYDLPAASHVTLKVFDLTGREVATLVDRFEGPGVRSVSFDAAALATGVYYYRLRAGGYVETKKLVVLR